MKKTNKIKRFFTNIINWFKLVGFLPNVIGKEHPRALLDLIEKFVSLEGYLYPQGMKFGRSMQDSVDLLVSLVEYYKDTKSQVTLEQITTVIKEDFIGR